jgi:hypothetical protein
VQLAISKDFDVYNLQTKCCSQVNSTSLQRTHAKRDQNDLLEGDTECFGQMTISQSHQFQISEDHE